MTIVAAITNNTTVGIPFDTTTGGTMIAGGATATLTMPDSAMTALEGYRVSGACSITYSQLSNVGPTPYTVGRKQLAGTTYAVEPEDNGCILEAINASGCTVTLPANVPRGVSVGILRYASGAVAIEAGSGATVRAPGAANSINAQYGMASAYVRENVTGLAAEWIVSGNIA